MFSPKSCKKKNTCLARYIQFTSLHVQKVSLLKDIFNQSELFKKLSKSSDWLKKAGPSKKGHISFVCTF